MIYGNKLGRRHRYGEIGYKRKPQQEINLSCGNSVPHPAITSSSITLKKALMWLRKHTQNVKTSEAVKSKVMAGATILIDKGKKATSTINTKTTMIENWYLREELQSPHTFKHNFYAWVWVKFWFKKRIIWCSV